jgi:hypothetical protein
MNANDRAALYNEDFLTIHALRHFVTKLLRGLGHIRMDNSYMNRTLVGLLFCQRDQAL